PFKSKSWDVAFDAGTFKSSLVNSCELRDSPEVEPSGWTPLHYAASAGAPAWVAERLVEAGAARCVKDWLGRTPLDLAKSVPGCGQDLLAALTPSFHLPAEQLDDSQLDAMESHFHGLIKEASMGLSDKGHLSMLPVRVLLESHLTSGLNDCWNFPIPGMYGGFYNIHLVLGGDGRVSHLQCESWCRVSGGSGRRDKVTADGVELLESGFV
uniref:ANK_REP_REGION domain-containing protein n=1 Tax=Macrostomum lignano TaxID=282301 RepID=A0A1I8J7N1_9PLAT